MEVGLLIASPQMKDPFFEGSLILVCHHDESGALGIVINRETRLTVSDVLEQLSIEDKPGGDYPVLWGGPVQPESGHVIIRGRVAEDEGWNLPHDVTVSPSADQLLRAVERADPFHLALGYAGWGPGQLDDEIERGSWLYTELDQEIIFKSAVDERYDHALARLGLTAE